MQYKGIEVKELTEPQIINPPRPMLVWDTGSTRPGIACVYAIGPSSMAYPVRTIDNYHISESIIYQHCADIPDDPKSRRATNREVSKWLALGNGEVTLNNSPIRKTSIYYSTAEENKPCIRGVSIRK